MRPEPSDTSRRAAAGRIGVSALALVALTGMGMLPAAAAHADVDPDDLHVDAYIVSTNYGGIGVDIKALDTGLVTSLDEVRVTVHRSVGPDVVKASRSTGSVVSTVKAGAAVTAPIVITPGSYDEAGSSSWVQPDAV